MKLAFRILPAIGLVVALAMEAASQNVTTTLDSIDRVTTAFDEVNGQIQDFIGSRILGQSNDVDELLGALLGLDHLADVLGHEIQIFDDNDNPQPLDGNDSDVVLDAIFQLEGAAATMLDGIEVLRGTFSKFVEVTRIADGITQLGDDSESYVEAILDVIPSERDMGSQLLEKLDDYFAKAAAIYGR
ncbi:hypothetical protein OH77DRAFT_1429120 [Trametes cingulata]|nr:hypothetical protein OH77DRAFT_1429120 [Trametes cingulata]